MSQENTTKASECSTPANLNISDDNNTSEMGVGQSMVVGRKLLRPIVPGDDPTYVGERQYAAILRLRGRRLRIKEARERRLLQAKNIRPRGPDGRFVMIKDDQEGSDGGSMMEWSPAPTDNSQQVTTVGNEAQSITPIGFYWSVFTTNEGGENNTPAGIGFYYPFSTNNGGENVGGVASSNEVPNSDAPNGFFWPIIVARGYEDYIGKIIYDSVVTIGDPVGYFYWPVVATNEHGEDIGECAYRSEAPISNPAGDFCWPVVATNDDEENVGEVAYNSILNLESPDPTTLLRTMMGNNYNMDKVSEQFQNLERLQAPGFTTLLTVMNNAGYDPAADSGPYDVNKVMTKLEGW